MLWVLGRTVGGFVMALTHWLMWWAMLAAALAIFSFVYGLPHLLVHYRYHQTSGNVTMESCTYVSVLGLARDLDPGTDVRYDCPIFVLLPVRDRFAALIGERVT